MVAPRSPRLIVAWALVGLFAASCAAGESGSTTTVTLPLVALRPPSNADVTDPPVVDVVTTNDASSTSTDPFAASTTMPTSTSTTSTSTTSTTSTTTTTLPPVPVNMLFSGEVWAQKGIVNAASSPAQGLDFGPMFAEIASTVSAADLALCHFETPVSPVELVTAMSTAGYDRCSTASEHVFDGGVEAMNAMAIAFDNNGLTQSGYARTPDEMNPILMDVKGLRVAHLAYTLRYDTPFPTGEPWRSALIDIPRIIADATTARSSGAEMVILSLHWGNADSAAPTAQQRAWADEITRSGMVDLIVGAHSHVLQPIEQVNGVWVAYSLGNSLTYMPTNSKWSKYTQDGALVSFSVTRSSGGRVAVGTPVVRPTWVDKDNGCVVRDVLTVLAHPESYPMATVRGATASLKRTTQILGTQLLAAN